MKNEKLMRNDIDKRSHGTNIEIEALTFVFQRLFIFYNPDYPCNRIREQYVFHCLSVFLKIMFAEETDSA